jgi:probable type-2 restriction enzyme mthZI
MKYTLKNELIEDFNGGEPFSFPKYTSQLINWANQNAQGTRPAVVGQMSELFPEFMASGEEITIENWRNWYVERYPDAFDRATDKIFAQVENLRNAMILASLAERKGTTYRPAAPEEESVGIDGYVGNVPYSVKPDIYKTMGRLSETIDVKMIYYTKTKNGLTIEIEE